VVKYKTKNGDKTKATWDYQLGIWLIYTSNAIQEKTLPKKKTTKHLNFEVLRHLQMAVM
jgi:hypothetical protein